MLGYRPPPGQLCSGGRSPILMRSEPPPVISLDDSDSPPIPDSLPMLLPISISGIDSGSAGRATGRAPPIAPDWLRELLDRRPPERDEDRDPPEREVDLELDLDFDLDVPLRLVLLRPLLELRFAVDFFPPERDAVERLAVLRPPVDFLAVDRLAVDRLPVDFLVDFFFAAICPPFGCAIEDRAGDVVRMSAAVTCVYSIGILQIQEPSAVCESAFKAGVEAPSE